MKKIAIGALLGISVITATPVFAQTWRCPGNIFTNNRAEVQRIGNCEVIDNRISVILPDPSSTTNNSTPDGASTGRDGMSAGERNNARQAERQAQQDQAREQARQRQIDTQLRQARAELSALETEYNNGEPQRMGPEFRNYQMYLDRVERLRTEIGQKRAQIQALEASR